MTNMRKIYKRGVMEDWRASAIIIGANISATLILFSTLLGHAAYSLPICFITFSISALCLRGRRMLALFDRTEVTFWSAVNIGLITLLVLLFG